MISDELLVTMHGPSMTVVTTRDARLRPHMCLGAGIRVHADRLTATIFIPPAMAPDVVANLEHNGRLSATVGDPITHQNFQLKGRFLSCSPTTREEEAIQDLWMEKLVANLWAQEEFGVPKLLRSFIIHPSTAIVLKIEEIFDQRPGPTAGQVLYREAR
jgi:hypothetical protein